MIPLRDTLRPALTPWVTRVLIAANIVAFFTQLAVGAAGELLVLRFGFVPERLFHPSDYPGGLALALLSLVTSTFLHGGVVHISGNLIYLAIFGNDVENRFGHGLYLLFYVASGAVGSLTHAFIFPLSPTPSIGASGCVAGILGAFLLLERQARIVTLAPVAVQWAAFEMPAIVFVPVWFVLQFLSGWIALSSARGSQEVGGVAWWVHIGAFLFGALVGFVAAGARGRPGAVTRG